MEDYIEIGQVVRSIAGRDKGKFFVVIGYSVEDENIVLLSDGDFRRYENPKKKKYKHIIKTDDNISIIAKRIKDGDKITNPFIKKELLKIISNDES